MKQSKSVVLIVLNPFTNDSRVLKEALTLQANGYRVIVVALHETELPECEVVQGIQVDRVRLVTRGWPRYRLFKFIKYFEFSCKVARRYRRWNIFHCNDLTALPVGAMIKRLFNRSARIVYDAHEYETEVYGLSQLEKRLRRCLEKVLMGSADRVIAVSDSIANEYVRLYGIAKPALVLNCPPLVKPAKFNLLRAELGIKDNQTIFLYQGGFSPGRGIELLLEAFSRLDDDRNVIVFMGYGPLEGAIRDFANRHPQIFLRAAVSPDVLLRYTASADYGVLFYENNCLNHYYCSPNKMFEYLMAGIPVLCADLFEMRRLVEEKGIGVVAEENTVEGFLAAVKRSLALDYQAVAANVAAARKFTTGKNRKRSFWMFIPSCKASGQ